MAKKARFPKAVGGVRIPRDLRRAGDKLIGRVDSRLGREALAAGMTLAAAAVIAMTGCGRDARGYDGDAPDAPEPPVPPEPPIAPIPPVPPVPPAPPVPPEPPVRPSAMPPISPQQAQAVADALGNVAEAALARFLKGRRFG